MIRDAIAQVIHDCDMERDSFRDIADAVIAALPGLVKPLEWEDVGLGRHIAGNYSTKDRMDYWGVYRNFVAIEDGYQQPTLEAAKAAAQVHYTAQIMAAFGIDAAAMKEGKDA